jgi:hypothetical protein
MATRCSIYLLYWYKFTNTDAWRLGTQFPCCTGTKVQNKILTQKAHLDVSGSAWTQQSSAWTHELGAKVLSLLALLVQKYKY